MPRTNIADPFQTVGGLFAMSADAVTCVFRQLGPLVTVLVAGATNRIGAHHRRSHRGVGRHSSERTGI
jgi:hypothetical protein